MASSLADWKDSECGFDIASLILYFQLQIKTIETHREFLYVFVIL